MSALLQIPIIISVIAMGAWSFFLIANVIEYNTIRKETPNKKALLPISGITLSVVNILLIAWPYIFMLIMRIYIQLS